MKQYFAIIHKDEEKPYSVVFPDLPGCLSAGDTYSRAIDNAIEALRRYAEKANADLPEPKSFEDLIAEEEVQNFAANAAFVGIPLLMEKGRAKSINITVGSVD